MYYVSRYTEEKIYLKGTKLEEESKKLSFEELEEFVKENTVIGYNPVTKKLAEKRIEDVESYLNSKLRLTGVTLGQGIKVETTLFKEINNKVYCMHEIEGKTILVAEPLIEYGKYVEYKGGEPYRNVRSIRLTMPDNVEKNVDVIRLNWGSILTPAVYVSNVSILDIIIDFPFTSKVVGFSPLFKHHSVVVKDVIFTENFSMENAKVSKNAFNLIAEFKSGEIVQTKDGYKLLSESIGKWFEK